MLVERFSEDISYLVFRRNIISFRISRDESFPNKMTINFNMFYSLTEDWILSNMQSCMIVTVKVHRFIKEYPSEARKGLIQINSLVAFIIARYSASAANLEIKLCFFVF